MPTTINYNRAELETIIELDSQLKKFPPLLAKAVATIQPGSSVSEELTLALQLEATWQQMIMSLPAGNRYPAQYNGSAIPEQQYASDIVAARSNKTPALAVVARIDATNIREKTLIKNILAKNAGFNLNSEAAHTWFKVVEQPAAANEVTVTGLKEIQALQRSVKLTEGPQKFYQTAALMESGLTTAYEIYTLGRADFTTRMQQRGLTAHEINFIFCRATAISNTVTYLSSQYMRYEAVGALVPQYTQFGVYTPPVQLPMPDLQTIFGSLNSCTCTDCQSVYSAAAYYTDLLHWLKSDVVCEPSGPAAYTVLTAANRRPDLPHILLNCKNTNTLLPYIDLVNEVLSVNMDAISVADYQLLQTRKTTPELLLEPENRFPLKEAKLATAFYPWNLPYNAPYDEAASYLAQLGMPYHELMNTFSKPDEKYNTLPWAKAYLNLNDEEYNLIINDHSAEAGYWNKYWGLTSAPGTVGQVLRATGLSIDELKELLQSLYINLRLWFRDLTKVTIIPPVGADDCNIDAYTFSPAFSTDVADRLMRFLRLKRKSGLTVAELDAIIMGYGAMIDESLVIRLSSFLAYAKAYSVSAKDMTLWVSVLAYIDLGTYPFTISAYFKNKFQHPKLADDIRAFFAPLFVYAPVIDGLTAADKQKIAIALNTTIPDIDLLTSYLNLGASSLHIFNLATYDRYIQFGKAMGMELADLVALFTRQIITTPAFSRMPGFINDPFISGWSRPQEIWELTRQINEFKKLGIEPAALNDLVSGSGYFGLDALTGIAVVTQFSDEAKVLWEKIKEAVITTRNAFPGGYGPDNKPLVSLNPTAPELETIVYQQFADHFIIEPVLTKSIIEKYSIAWASGLVNDVVTNALWSSAAIEKKFINVYRLIKRISLLSGICGMDANGLATAVKIKFTVGSSFPEDAFYWLTNDFSVFDLSRLLLIKNATLQAAAMGITQEDYLNKISGLHAIIPVLTEADVKTNTAALHGILGESAPLKNLSAFEFEQLAYRAHSIAANNKNLVAVMEAFAAINGTREITAISPTESWSWIWDNSWTVNGTGGRAVLSNYTKDFRRILNARFETDEARSKAILPVQNGLRDRLRNALVSWYIGQKGFKNSNTLYSHFLLDTEMAPCMKTSRLVQAISSVQLLVHRGLMGLEPAVCMDEDDKREWEWRKNFQVWVANRKVFLYPENWIEPTLRLNKTPFFKEAEDLLLQDEVNDKNCEKAFSNYLTNLHETARLDIRGVFVQEEPELPITEHVFARTWNAPYIYYYRNRSKDLWMPWEKMELDIEGDHIIPIVFNRRLYLFWPLFIEKEHRKIKRVIDGEEQNTPYYEIKMCYSKLEFGKWSSKKILNATMLAGYLAGREVFNNLDRKLGKGVPAGTYIDVQNPNVDIIRYLTLRHYGFPADVYEKFAPTMKQFVAGETYRGNLVWDNANFKDYAYVTLEKKSFFFWAEVLSGTGDLIIHCRRDFDPVTETYHNAYTEMAYEDSFKISACDEKVEIIPPVIPEPGFYDKRFVSRPFLTLPDGMLLKEGLDRPASETPELIPEGLYIKQSLTHAPENLRIFKTTNASYTLTYPHQYKHALWTAPFFFSDQRHTFFMERKKGKECICNLMATGVPSTGLATSQLQIQINCQYVYSLSNKFLVKPHEHPFSCTMLSEFNRHGIKGLLNSGNPAISRQQPAEDVVKDFIIPYQPVSAWVSGPYPVNKYDFDRSGAYSLYNWEVFFHLVSVVARQLRQNNKFADALRWLQYIFDPTNRETQYGVQRVWKIKPFMIDVSKGSIQYQLRLLSGAGLSAAEEVQREELVAQIEDWRDNPFEPHRIAAMRPRAYMLWTVMEYIDILTDWGDWLFRQDTMESINEAINLYILAAELLGPRPEKIPKATSTDKSFAQIQNGLDEFSNVAAHLENQLTALNFASNCTCNDHSYPGNSGYSLPNLFFCIPDNPKMIEYWNRVEDRLFKIRHCMNIDGQVRELALFAPPIDPALLVRARAAGLIIADALSDLNAPSPHYRFSYLLQKATDFCNEVKTLGGQLLAAFEKRDAEELTLIRQLHEQNILKATRNLKKLQIEEAKKSMTNLEHSKKLIQIRLSDYEGRAYVSDREQITIDFTEKADKFMQKEQTTKLIAQVLGLIPQIHASLPPTLETGGRTLAQITDVIASSFGVKASMERNKASKSATYAGYDRRREDWNLSIKTAKEELNQIEVQLLSAEIRIAITEKELDNHDLQAEQSKEIYDWVKDKFTNQALYNWMSGELMGLHRKAYQLAYDMAKQAQKAYHKELNGKEDIIKFSNWESSKKGLLAGDHLSGQLKELDAAYMKLNTREFELTKSISLRLLDPEALVDLIMNGTCTVELPEWLFNLEFPDEKLYAMRMKSIAVSVPCITGPQTSANVKLSMKHSFIRWNENDILAAPPFSGLPSVNEEIITSSAVNDPAVFEMNLRDERYMPFENQGVVSQWDISLPNQHEFDYSTISDLVLHIRYVAKGKGGEFTSPPLPKPAHRNDILLYKNQIMSWKHDFPQEWHQLISQNIATTSPDNAFTKLKSISPALTVQHIPYKTRLAGKTTGTPKRLFYLYKNFEQEIIIAELPGTPPLALIINNFEMKIDGNKVEDIWIVYDYTA